MRMSFFGAFKTNHPPRPRAGFAISILAGMMLFSLAAQGWASEPSVRTNGRDEIVLRIANADDAPLHAAFPAAAIYATSAGARVVALSAVEITVPPRGTAEAAVPAAALSAKNAAMPGQEARRTGEQEPRLDALAAYLASQKDLPRSTAQCAVLALMEDLDYAGWVAFRGKPNRESADAPLLEAVDALGILRAVALGREFRLAGDAAFKMAALRNPMTRAKAAQLFGLTTPGDAPAGQAPADVGQLLHLKPGDNCPVCRMRAQAQAPSNGL
jgi:hypothetical protein